MAIALERRIEALEQIHSPVVVAVCFRCQACGAIVRTLDEAEVCGHHRPPPAAGIRVVVGFGKPTT